MAAPSILMFGSAVRLDIYHNILGSVVALIVIQELRQHYSKFFSTDDTSSKSFCHLIIILSDGKSSYSWCRLC